MTGDDDQSASGSFLDDSDPPPAPGPDATVINREEVDRRLDRLEREYGAVPVVETRVAVGPDEFRALPSVGAAADGETPYGGAYVGGAYAFVVRRAAEMPTPSDTAGEEAAADRDRLLLGMGRAAQCWGPPGGGIEDGETVEETARREVREETGVECTILTPRRAVRQTVVPEGADGGGDRVPGAGDGDDPVPGLDADASDALFVVFDARYDGGEIRVQASELYGAAWFASLPERTHPFVDTLDGGWSAGDPDDGTDREE